MMHFKSYLSILLGINLIGLSLGVVVGYYIQSYFENHYWLYLSPPIFGIGSFLMIYGALSSNKNDK